MISELIKDPAVTAQILLFGGPFEKELNKRIIESFGGRVFDAGSDNSLRHFASLIQHCSVVLSADSLAMHIGLATKRRVVVLFGPTSSSEIDLFGLGEKIRRTVKRLLRELSKSVTETVDAHPTT